MSKTEPTRIGVEEARKTLGDLVDAIRHGTTSEIIITRYGRPVARLTAHQGDIVDTKDLHHTTATVIARARANSGLTTPAFDYQISVEGIGGPRGPLGNEVYDLANEHMPEVVAGQDNRLEERDANWLSMWEALQPELETYAQRCRDRRYTGWSSAAQARGQRIQYAD